MSEPPAGEPTSRPLDPEHLGDHLDRLYRAALGLCGSPHEAEDLVQETYVQVLRRPRFLRSRDDLGYLMRVLHNTFYSRYRAQAGRPRMSELPQEDELAEQRPSATPDEVVQSHEVLAAVSALPPPFRDAVAAVDLAGLSYREAAAALGVAQGTIMSRLHRGRSQVAQAIGDP